MTDYLIVGAGLAGIAFAETALQNQKNIFVIDGNLYHSSKVAAGLYNPVVLKRFTALANAEGHLSLLKAFYTELETKLATRLHFELPVLRKFSSIEEQNDWFIASDKPALSGFLSPSVLQNQFSGIDAPFGYGKVNRTGYVDTALLLERYKSWLSTLNLLLNEAFDYDLLNFKDNTVSYKNIKAKHIVFAEGFGMHQNPFFRHLPLDGAKGELLVIKAPDLSLDVILNSSIFILPLGNNLFKIGATYNWTDKTEIPTREAKLELIDRIKQTVNCEFEIVSHYAGVRPTVKDRKPLLGTAIGNPNVHILNGLGTRGVMLAPAMAKTLFENIEHGNPLPREIDIKRFDKKA